MNAFITIFAVLSCVFALAGWILWRQFEFYDKRDEDDDDAN